MIYEEFPESDDAVAAHEFLDAVFPGEVIVPAALPDHVRQRLFDAGFGLAEVLCPDGSSQLATYSFEVTGIVQAIGEIWLQEQAGHLPAGSHARAIDSVVSGEFMDEWGAFLPRQDES